MRNVLYGLIGLAFSAQWTIQAADPAPALPAEFQGKAVVLSSTDPDYARANASAAVKPDGQGGISQATVVKLTEDIPVYRMWSGPAKKDSRGNTNRLGQWWGAEKPAGTQPAYRTNYEICMGWNDLTWMATCTLKKGAVVAIGPGQSVSAATCGDPTGKESYPANAGDWQIWISTAWSRMGTDKELDCPPEASDYEVDLNDISKKKPAP